MIDWFEDPWVMTALNMGEDFFQNHRETMPENPHNVWDEDETTYFVLTFFLWSAQTKFRLKFGDRFYERVEQYRNNIYACFSRMDDFETEKELSQADYDLYLEREKLYLPILMKSNASLLKTLTGSTMKEACKVFVNKACKRYIFSERDLVKIISPWLFNKNIEFQSSIEL